MTRLAKKTGLATLLKVLRALGLRLAPVEDEAA